ncbi:MAG TPA: DUF6680 family protein [Rhizomicrobium sp.]
MQGMEFIFGLKLAEFVTLVGVVASPVIAVLITLAIEHFRRRRDERTQVLRFLLATRATPADPNYNGAINLIPVYFNKHAKVMAAWQNYMNAVRFKPAPGDEAAQNVQTSAKQTALIFSIMNALHLKLSESEIQSEAYISGGFVARDSLYLSSLSATVDLAASAKRSAEATEKLLAIVTNNSQRSK